VRRNVKQSKSNKLQSVLLKTMNWVIDWRTWATMSCAVLVTGACRMTYDWSDETLCTQTRNTCESQSGLASGSSEPSRFCQSQNNHPGLSGRRRQRVRDSTDNIVLLLLSCCSCGLVANTKSINGWKNKILHQTMCNFSATSFPILQILENA